MKQPLVSVIIPNYNHAKYLDERILSVLTQTYQNFEVIILDDVSKDNSREVIEKYRTNKHVSHIVYNEVNSGSTFKQWDKGFNLAKGDLIWIAESDDSCENVLLEKLVAEFQKDDKLVLAFCNSMIIDQDGNQIGVIQRKAWQKDIHCSGMDFIHDYLYQDNLIYNASSALFRKDITMQIGKQYIDFKASGDWLFWIEICEKGNICMLQSPLNHFRKHLGNVTIKAMCNGVQQTENKRIFDYIVSKHEISNSAARKYKIHNIYVYKYNIKFESDEVREKAIGLWDPTRLDMLKAAFINIYHLCRYRIKKLLLSNQ